MTGTESLLPLFGLSVGMQAMGTAMQTRAQIQAAKFNAAIARQQAEQEERAKEIDIYRLERQRRQMLGQQRSLYAKAGLDIEGTPLEVLADTEAQFELEKRMIEYGTQVRKQRALAEERFLRRQGRQIGLTGALGVGTTLLGGLAEAGLYKRRTPEAPKTPERNIPFTRRERYWTLTE